MTEGRRLAVTLEARRLVGLRDRWLDLPEWGRVGGRTGARLPEAAGSPRRGCCEGAQEAHADEPRSP